MQGACPFIGLREGKVIKFYWGFIHRKCYKPFWKEQLEKAAALGWLVPAGPGMYEVAPQYR